MQGGEGTFFVSRNLAKKPYGSWAFSLIECVAVWALKTPVPHTDVLKTHSSQSFSTELLEYKGTGSKHLTQTCEVLKAYDTELAENRDKKSYRGKEIDM